MSEMKMSIVSKSVYVLCLFILLPYCSHAQDENEYFDSGLRLVRSNRRLEDAILKLEQAKKLQPENRQCYLALAAAQAGRSIMIAQAEYNRSWLDNDMDTFKKNLSDWSKNNTNSSSPWYSKSMPEKPYIKTFDDNLKYDRSKNDSEKRISELISSSLENASESLKLCKNSKDKANSYYFIGWLKFTKNNVFKIARISKKTINENQQEDFEKSINLDPDNYMYYRSLADSYFNPEGDLNKEGEKLGLQKIIDLYKKSLLFNSKQPLVVWNLFRLYSLNYANIENYSEEYKKINLLNDKYHNGNGIISVYKFINSYNSKVSSIESKLDFLNNIINSAKSYEIRYEPEFQGYLKNSIYNLFNSSINHGLVSDFSNMINYIIGLEIDINKKIDITIKIVTSLLDIEFLNLKMYSFMSQMMPTGISVLRLEVYKKVTGENQQKIIDGIISVQKEIARRREVKFANVYFTSFP